MKAISIRQPWAWAVIHAGKFIENRSWATNYRGPLYIHASAKFDMDAKRWMQRELKLQVPPNLPVGGIVGQVTLYRCVKPDEIVPYKMQGIDTTVEILSMEIAEMLRSPWWQGPVGWLFRDPQALPFVPCRGALRFFEAPEQGVLAL